MANEEQTPLSRFIAAATEEHGRTRRMLDALPPDQADFKPHERSSPARQLAWTFVVEEMAVVTAIRGEPFGTSFPKPPDELDQIIAAFEKKHEEMLNVLQDSGNTMLHGTVKFPTGPKQMGDVPLERFLWFMLHDQIHHRGQLSVYVRMTGGKVPATYGPSADERW